MSNENYKRLVKTLYNRTKSSILPWKTAPKGDEFQISFSSNSVRISRVIKRNSSDDFMIELSDALGEVFDSLFDVKLDMIYASTEDAGTFFKIMSESYNMARRSALGADKVLNSILDELADDIPF